MERLSASQRTWLREAAERYSASLPGSEAEGFLESRGLGDKKIHEWFRLGFVKDACRGHEMYRGMLAIPFIRPYPKPGLSVVSIRFRCLQDHEHNRHGKYNTTAGDRPRMFNTMALLRPSPTIAITEGELDAITAHVSGIPAVGISGSESWQPHFREPFLGYREVFILADGDEAGLKFGNTVAKTLPNAKVIPMPTGSDVNDLVNRRGKEALLERIT